MALDSSSEKSDFYGLLCPAEKYLRENCYRSDISIGEIADVCGISEVYLRKLFIKQTGRAPKQHIIEFRIERAKELLSYGDMKIEDVAEKCGFTNQYHFSRLFKKKTGMTPSEYMKGIKRKNKTHYPFR